MIVITMLSIDVFFFGAPQMHEKSHLACIQFVYGICCVRALNLIGALRLAAPVKILSMQHTNTFAA